MTAHTGHLRSIGPESESRSGTEAPARTLGQPGVPGERDGLPEGSLPGPFLGPHGDENRPPPGNAPVPTGPAETVESLRRTAEKPTPDGG
jgi:hypothetical protein